MNWFYLTGGTLLVLATCCESLRSQPPELANLRGDSSQTRKRLAEAEAKLVAGKASDATEDIQRILDESATDLISIDGKHYQTAQSVAQQILAKLPTDALKNYQDQIEIPARKLLALAKESRNPEPLWKLLDRYFVSRPADEGLLLLGDILFERGEFQTAETLWRKLLPDGNTVITYPNSQSDSAQVRARIILAELFQGDAGQATSDLKEFQTRFAEAKGALAGKHGLLASILSEQFKTPPHLCLSSNSGNEWVTFGGAADHSSTVGIRFPAEYNHQPISEMKLKLPIRGNDPAFRTIPQTPYGHPVVIHRDVFVTNGVFLCGFNLVTKKPFDPLRISNAAFNPILAEKLPAPCPSLTAAGDRLYVRTGPLVFRSSDGSGSDKDESKSAIICFELNSENPHGVTELWRVKAPVFDGKTAIWEGAPQVNGRRMWAAFARIENGRIIHGIACYDPADTITEPDRPAWTVDVCDSALSPGTDNRTRQELVTLAGRNIVFCSNTGAVVAVNASTGKRVWAFRYPRSRKADANRSGDPAPAVAYGGRVFVAPTDADHVYALDPESGNLLWEAGSEESAPIDLVGVAAGRLIISVGGRFEGLRGLALATGSYRKDEGGWTADKKSASPGHGRGFVTEDAVFWPSPRSGYLVHNTKDGSNRSYDFSGAGSTVGGFFGNVIYADGRLIVVTATHLKIYLSELAPCGPPGDRSDEDAARLKFNRLTTQAERSLADGQFELAWSTLVKVARSELPNPYRAWAAARLLLLSPRVDAEAKIPGEIQSLLTPELLGEWVISSDGVPVTLQGILLKHLGREPPTPEAVVQTDDVPAPDQALHLSPEAEIVRTLKLPGSTPLLWIPGFPAPRHLYLTTSTEIVAVSLTGSTMTRHQSVGLITHVAEIAGGFLVAGPHSIALYAAKRLPVWVFRVPITNPLPLAPGEFQAYSDRPVTPLELSAFRICGSWLVSRLGSHYLIAFNIHKKCVGWILGADGNSGIASITESPTRRFGSEYAMNRQFIAVQLSDGVRWFIRTDTGRLFGLTSLGTRTSRVWWTQAPWQLERNLLAIPDGPGTVSVVNLLTQKVKWVYRESKRESSLSGEPPQLLNCGDRMIIATPRNYGVELDCLSREDGKSVWRDGPALLELETGQLSLSNADADAEQIYVPLKKSLTAFELKSGKTVWEIDLPSLQGVKGWVVRAGQRCAVVYPQNAIPRESASRFWVRAAKTLNGEPYLWRLPGLAVGLYDTWVARTVPILLIDLETGRVLSRIDIPSTGPAITVCLEEDRAVVATGNRVCWLK